MAKKTDKTEERIVAVEGALSKTEQFIERNQRIITYVIGGLIVVTLLVFGYRKFVSIPKEKAAQKAMYMPELYFEKDSLNLALNGAGESIGFLGIIDDYGSTSAANLARYYAGVCYLNLGEYEEAIRLLKKFKGDDIIVPGMALGAIGDAYMQLGDIDQAIKYYVNAASRSENDFTTPTFLLKAGWAYEIKKDYEKAVEMYEKIKFEFPKTREAREIDKYVARAKASLGEI
jgi:tetratricopeptide (TPR) repeat protein